MISVQVEREGDAIYISVRTHAGGSQSTMKLTRRSGAALCAILGQACGRMPCREYALKLEGDLTVGGMLE